MDGTCNIRTYTRCSVVPAVVVGDCGRLLLLLLLLLLSPLRARATQRAHARAGYTRVTHESAHTNAGTRAHTHTRKRTHTRTRKRTHAHTYEHTRARESRSVRVFRLLLLILFLFLFSPRFCEPVRGVRLPPRRSDRLLQRARANGDALKKIQ